MKKKVFGRKLQRDTNERKALFKGLINDLVLKESIQTTLEKAKAIRSQVEKLITKAKRKGTLSTRLLQPYLSENAYKKVLEDLAIRFASRPGGYVRIIKLGSRFSDNASMAVIELVEKKEMTQPKTDQAMVEKEATIKPAKRAAKETVESKVVVDKKTKKSKSPKQPKKKTTKVAGKKEK